MPPLIAPTPSDQQISTSTPYSQFTYSRSLGPSFQGQPSLRSSQLIQIDEILEREMRKYTEANNPISQISSQLRETSRTRIINDQHSAAPYVERSVIF
jgi:hypothetical protein